MNNSGLNTILIVLLILIVLVGVVWFVQSEQDTQEGLNVELNLPAEDGGNE